MLFVWQRPRFCSAWHHSASRSGLAGPPCCFPCALRVLAVTATWLVEPATGASPVNLAYEADPHVPPPRPFTHAPGKWSQNHFETLGPERGGCGMWELELMELFLSSHQCFILPIPTRWSSPLTLTMKGWGWLALLLGALLGTAWARRSQDLHCGGKGTKRKDGRK